MIIKLTDKTAVVDCWYESETGYYDVPYPKARLYEHDKKVVVHLTSRECQGLTLALLKGLDSSTHGRLVWVSTKDEVTHGKTT